ncbi:2764_t:CDS:2 [Paraglomus occultum]|uniref:2764_t:CDS:1 n=1 Tax=Paraglomus occultum TaxID=144539 RepID=A0A9N9ANS6_9GLOM|nr:2764_t:CDS:2 [Paraglomus occultum]
MNSFNHPSNLNVEPSQGPSESQKLFRRRSGDKIELRSLQDVKTFGLAGKVWDSTYALDLYLCLPPDHFAFDPPCPIPSYLFHHDARTQYHSSHYTILELGSGTGYLGITLASRLVPPFTLILTDLPDVLPLLNRNVSNNSRANTDHIIVAPLEWGNSAHSECINSKHRIDLVIASDLVYFPELFDPLIKTLLEICGEETIVVFGYKVRAQWKEEAFWEQVGRFFYLKAVRVNTKARTGICNTVREGTTKVDERENVVEENEANFRIFGEEDGIFIFIGRKRAKEKYKRGVDDTFATIQLLQIDLL